MKKYPPILLLVALMTGCTIYHPYPLATKPNASKDLSHIIVKAADMPLPELFSHKFDASDGLDMTEVAMLAVVNNPQLKIARDNVGISHAQAFAAGLLPDPTLGITGDQMATASMLGSTTAFSLSLSYAINKLLSWPAGKQAARATERQTDLNLLWQEWQVVSQARLLFVRNTAQQKLLDIMRQEHALLATRYAVIEHAVSLGELTLSTANLNLIALQNMASKINTLARQINTNRHALNALLGLSPETQLLLVGDATIPPLEEAKIHENVAHLAQRRPDLRALEFGYESQEQRFRQAVWAQFPSLNIGVNRARDNFATYTRGIGLSVGLPIFNGNRGNVAIALVTRQKLHDAYQLRLNLAVNMIAQILQDQKLLEQQLKNIENGAVALKLTASNAQAAFNSGSIDSLIYTKVRNASLAKQTEAIYIKQILLEQRVTLLTLMGGDLAIMSRKKE